MTDTIRHFLTESQKDTIRNHLALGLTDAAAAEYVGCTLEMIQKEELFDHSFAEQCAHNRLRSEIALLQRMTNATDDMKNWRAAAWLLERLYPERYARRKPRTYTRAQLEEHLTRVAQLVASMLPAEAQLNVEQQIKDYIYGVTHARDVQTPAETNEHTACDAFHLERAGSSDIVADDATALRPTTDESGESRGT